MQPGVGFQWVVVRDIGTELGRGARRVDRWTIKRAVRAWREKR